MKQNVLHLWQSPLRLAVLTGFIGLEIIDLVETLATHWVSPAALIRIHTVTALLSVVIVAVCVYLITAPAPARALPAGRHSSRLRNGDVSPSQTAVAKAGFLPAALRGQWSEGPTNSVIEDQVLDLP